MKNKITIEEALAVIEEYHEADYFIQDKFQNGLRGGEYWDNTMDTWYYWHECKEIVDGFLPVIYYKALALNDIVFWNLSNGVFMDTFGQNFTFDMYQILWVYQKPFKPIMNTYTITYMDPFNKKITVTYSPTFKAELDKAIAETYGREQ